jgi:hypothetical protein
VTPEELARLICAQENPGISQESIYHSGEPYRVRGGYINVGEGMPLWLRYLPLAAEILNRIADGDVK